MQKEKLLEDFKAGRLKLKDLSNFGGIDAAEVLRSYLSEKYSASLSTIANNSIDANDALGKNIENFIGAAQVPRALQANSKSRGNMRLYMASSFR